MVGVMTDQTEMAEQAYLAPGEAAKSIHVTPKTLTRMAERGEIRSLRLPSGHRRYLRADVEALAAGETPTALAPTTETKAVAS